MINAIKKTSLISPPTDCISPIGEELLLKGLKKETNAEFYASTTRKPSVYRGNPFQIEVAIAYGGDLSPEGPVEIMRFANRVPLLYQKGACAITETIKTMNWKPYGLQQSKGGLPQGPVIILVHIASVWTPFTSEAKEAIAHYPEIMDEIRLALQDVGRKLKIYVIRKQRAQHEMKKMNYIKKYIPHIAEALRDILDLSDSQEERAEDALREVLENERAE